MRCGQNEPPGDPSQASRCEPAMTARCSAVTHSTSFAVIAAGCRSKPARSKSLFWSIRTGGRSATIRPERLTKVKERRDPNPTMGDGSAACLWYREPGYGKRTASLYHAPSICGRSMKSKQKSRLTSRARLGCADRTPTMILPRVVIPARGDLRSVARASCL